VRAVSAGARGHCPSIGPGRMHAAARASGSAPRLGAPAHVAAESARLFIKPGDVSEKLRNVSTELGNVPEGLRNVLEEPGNVLEELRNVPEKLGSVPEELRNVAEELGNAGETQINVAELRKNSGEPSARGSTSHRNVEGCPQKLGGKDKIASGHVGNGAGNAEKLDPAACREAELLRNQAPPSSKCHPIRKLAPAGSC